MGRTSIDGTIRQVMAVRISAKGKEWLDEVARDTRSSRTEVVMACFALAAQNRAEIVNRLKGVNF